jgi:Flp pilus assembly pilin Flp
MLNLLVSLQLLVAGAKDRLRDDEGAIAIEYAIMAVVIALGLIVSANLAGEKIASFFTAISTETGIAK